MNPKFKIILKYASIIFLIRFILGFIIALISPEIQLVFVLILLIPILVLCWILTYNGTTKLSKYIKNKRNLEYTGDLIIAIPVAIDAIFSSIVTKSFDGLTGSFLLLTICFLASHRAANKSSK